MSSFLHSLIRFLTAFVRIPQRGEWHGPSVIDNYTHTLLYLNATLSREWIFFALDL